MKLKIDYYEFEYEIENDYIVITKCICPYEENEIVFPSIIDNKRVLRIGDNCCDFGDFWNVCTSIIIEEGIEEIGDLAFVSCTEMKKISIPASIRKIGKDIFKDCHNLETIVIDEENKIYTSCNGNNLIVEKESNALLYGIKTSILTDNIKVIKSHAFNNIKGLATIKINEGCEILEPNCIENCPNLKTVYISSTVKFADKAISKCYFISNIIIDSLNKYIKYNESTSNFENIEKKTSSLPLCDFYCNLTFEDNGCEHIEISYETRTDKITVNFNNNRKSFSCGELFKDALLDLTLIMGYVKENINNGSSNFGLHKISSKVRCSFRSKNYTNYSIVIKDENLYIKLISIVEYISPFQLNLLRKIPEIKYSIDDVNLEYITLPDIYNDMFDTYKDLNNGRNHPAFNNTLKVDSNIFINKENLKYVKIRKSNYDFSNVSFNNIKKIIIDDLDVLSNLPDHVKNKVALIEESSLNEINDNAAF